MSGNGKPIVVGVNGSHAAQQALRWASPRLSFAAALCAWSLGGIRDFAWTSRRVLRAESQALLHTAVAAARRHTGSWGRGHGGQRGGTGRGGLGERSAS